MYHTCLYNFAKASDLKKLRAALKAAGVSEATLLQRTGMESIKKVHSDAVPSLVKQIQSGHFN